VGREKLMWRRSCNSLSKRGLCSSGNPQLALIHLAGRGGEEVKKGDLVAAGLGGGPLELLEVRLPAVLLLRQRYAAAAIRGHKVGHTVLDSMVGASFVFLCERIFSRVSAATRSPAKPSDFVPGLDWGGTASTLQAAGGS
jgi:hypothetical protein